MGGQALAEFALILPALLLLTIGVLDLANVLSSYIELNDAVREATLYAADGDGYQRWCAYPPNDLIACPPGATGHQAADPDNIAYQLRFNAPALDPARVELRAPRCTPSPCDATSTVTITASYEAPVYTPVLANVLGGTVTMTVATTAQVIP